MEFFLSFQGDNKVASLLCNNNGRRGGTEIFLLKKIFVNNPNICDITAFNLQIRA